MPAYSQPIPSLLMTELDDVEKRFALEATKLL